VKTRLWSEETTNVSLLEQPEKTNRMIIGREMIVLFFDFILILFKLQNIACCAFISEEML